MIVSLIVTVPGMALAVCSWWSMAWCCVRWILIAASIYICLHCLNTVVGMFVFVSCDCLNLYDNYVSCVYRAPSLSPTQITYWATKRERVRGRERQRESPAVLLICLLLPSRLVLCTSTWLFCGNRLLFKKEQLWNNIDPMGLLTLIGQKGDCTTNAHLMMMINTHFIWWVWLLNSLYIYNW